MIARAFMLYLIAGGPDGTPEKTFAHSTNRGFMNGVVKSRRHSRLRAWLATACVTAALAASAAGSGAQLILIGIGFFGRDIRPPYSTNAGGAVGTHSARGRATRPLRPNQY